MKTSHTARNSSNTIDKCITVLTCFYLLFLGACVDQPENPQRDLSNLPEKIDFNFHIRPLLSDRCFTCHGPDKEARKADLALFTKEGAFGSLDSSGISFPFVPGDIHNSIAYERIISDDPEYMMPPPESNLSLNDYEKALFKKWIEQGAEWKDHWAYIKPAKPELPKVKNRKWSENPIDLFVMRQLEAFKLKPEPEATREQLIRRLSFDLTGLPPSPEEIDRFLADDSHHSYEALVDRLLASTAFGERMAFNWLDVARYADSHGYQDDRPRTMWPWRDWVISAFNSNMPYDTFVMWQLAGDLLPEATYEQRLATGFNRNHAITQEGGVINEEYLTEYAADRTQTFATAFLGQTMECARCHDHKYDPISQEEYYSTFAFFNNVKEERGQISYFDQAPKPSIEMADPLMDSTINQIRQMISRLEEEKSDYEEMDIPSFNNWRNTINWQESIFQKLDEDLLAYHRLDSVSDDAFLNEVANQPKGRVNINLPPGIGKPEVVSGKKGYGLRFNGANFLSLGEIGDFNHYDAFSFGGWIRQNGQHRKTAGLFARRNGELGRQGYQLAIKANDRLEASLIADGSHSIVVESQDPVAPGGWQHIFLTYDGSGKAQGISLYINGESQILKVQRDSLQGQSIYNGNDFLVGNWNHRARNLDNLYGFEGGAIDEIRVYQRELSSLEVLLLAGKKLSIQNVKVSDLRLHYLLTGDSTYQSLSHELRNLRMKDLKVPAVMVMEEEDTMKTTFLLARGAYDAPVRKVARITPSSILEFPEDLPANRLGLAQWLFDPDHPLTARVYVNRLWQMCFGQGIVKSPDDFGSQGALPSHPQLLDWLAISFMESGWDIKALLKQIVTSASYRQSAIASKQKRKKDPGNIWISRGPSVRLTAEMIRDQVLAVSGLLNRKIGGKWVKPYQPAGIWKEMANQIGENKYRPSQGSDLYRRSLYTYWKRTIPPPTMLTLDASERAVCTVKREATSTPLQALILLNDPQYVEAARVMAQHLISSNPAIEASIRSGFRSVLGRYPLSDESEILLELYGSELQRFETDPVSAEALLDVGSYPIDPAADYPSVAAMTIVINTIFNLDEAKFR